MMIQSMRVQILSQHHTPSVMGINKPADCDGSVPHARQCGNVDVLATIKEEIVVDLVTDDDNIGMLLDLCQKNKKSHTFVFVILRQVPQCLRF